MPGRRFDTTHAPAAVQATGNDTSAQAARSLSPSARVTMESRIAQHVRSKGDSRVVGGKCFGGATREEIQRALGGRVQTITARCADLTNGNPAKQIAPTLVCRGPQHVRKTESGRNAEVLVHVSFVDAARATQPTLFDAPDAYP